MVAAGVLVVGRVHPLLSDSDAVLDGLVVIGGASIIVARQSSLSGHAIAQAARPRHLQRKSRSEAR